MDGGKLYTKGKPISLNNITKLEIVDTIAIYLRRRAKTLPLRRDDESNSYIISPKAEKPQDELGIETLKMEIRKQNPPRLRVLTSHKTPHISPIESQINLRIKTEPN